MYNTLHMQKNAQAARRSAARHLVLMKSAGQNINIGGYSINPYHVGGGIGMTLGGALMHSGIADDEQSEFGRIGKTISGLGLAWLSYKAMTDPRWQKMIGDYTSRGVNALKDVFGNIKTSEVKQANVFSTAIGSLRRYGSLLLGGNKAALKGAYKNEAASMERAWNFIKRLQSKVAQNRAEEAKLLQPGLVQRSMRQWEYRPAYRSWERPVVDLQKERMAYNDSLRRAFGYMPERERRVAEAHKAFQREADAVSKAREFTGLGLLTAGGTGYALYDGDKSEKAAG